MDVQKFIEIGNAALPSGDWVGHDCSAPPFNKHVRHEWESKLLYSVIDCLSDTVHLLDYGCGSGSLRFSLFDRYANAKYIGLDPHYGRKDIRSPETDEACLMDVNKLNEAVGYIDCAVAGSVFTHLGWNDIENFLNKLKPMFDRGGQFGFTIFLNDQHTVTDHSSWYSFSPVDTFHIVSTTIEQYENYCKNNNLQFTLLPYDYKFDHAIPSNFTHQSFCNIRP